MLLSNLSTHTTACNSILDMTIATVQHPAIQGEYYTPASRSATSPKPNIPSDALTANLPAMPLLVQAFVQAAHVPLPSSEKSEKSLKPTLNFLASVFANISTVS